MSVHENARELADALRPFVDIGAQKGAWGVISKGLDSFAPMTVTVTKAQMLAAIAALAKAEAETTPLNTKDAATLSNPQSGESSA